MEEATANNQTTNQAKDMNRNPTGRGGFKDNPQNRSNGGWKKEMVFSYQYRRFMNMTIEELQNYALTPKDKRTVVEDLAYNAVVRAKNSLADVKEITDRTEGKPQQSVDVTSGDMPINQVRVIYADDASEIDKLNNTESV